MADDARVKLIFENEGAERTLEVVERLEGALNRISGAGGGAGASGGAPVLPPMGGNVAPDLAPAVMAPGAGGMGAPVALPGAESPVAQRVAWLQQQIDSTAAQGPANAGFSGAQQPLQTTGGQSLDLSGLMRAAEAMANAGNRIAAAVDHLEGVIGSALQGRGGLPSPLAGAHGRAGDPVGGGPVSGRGLVPLRDIDAPDDDLMPPSAHPPPPQPPPPPPDEPPGGGFWNTRMGQGLKVGIAQHLGFFVRRGMGVDQDEYFKAVQAGWAVHQAMQIVTPAVENEAAVLSGGYLTPEAAQRRWYGAIPSAAGLIGMGLGSPFGPAGAVVGGTIGTTAGQWISGLLGAKSEREEQYRILGQQIGLLEGNIEYASGYGPEAAADFGTTKATAPTLGVEAQFARIMGQNGGYYRGFVQGLMRPLIDSPGVGESLGGFLVSQAADPRMGALRDAVRGGGGPWSGQSRDFVPVAAVEHLLAAGRADFQTMNQWGQFLTGQQASDNAAFAEQASSYMVQGGIEAGISSRWQAQASMAAATGRGPFDIAEGMMHGAGDANRAAWLGTEGRIATAQAALRTPGLSQREIERVQLELQTALADREKGYAEAAGAFQSAEQLEVQGFLSGPQQQLSLAGIAAGGLGQLASADPGAVFGGMLTGAARASSTARWILSQTGPGGAFAELPWQQRLELERQQAQFSMQASLAPIQYNQFMYQRAQSYLGVGEAQAQAQIGLGGFFGNEAGVEAGYSQMGGVLSGQLAALQRTRAAQVAAGAAPEIINALDRTAAQIVAAIKELPMQGEQARFQAEQRVPSALSGIAQARMSIAQSEGTAWGGGVVGPLSQAFGAASGVEAVAKQHLDRVRDLYRRGQASEAQVMEAEAAEAQARAGVAGAEYQLLSQPSLSAMRVYGTAGQAFGGAAGAITGMGYGSSAALPALLAQYTATQATAQEAGGLYQTMLRRYGPTSENTINAAASWMGAEQAAAMQRQGMADFDPGSEYRMRQRELGFQTEAATRTFTGYGEVRGLVRAQMGMAEERLGAIRAYRSQLERSGVQLDPAMLERLQAQEIGARQEWLQGEETLEHGWQERIISQAFGMPGSFTRVAREFDPIRGVMDFGARNRFYGARGSDVESYRLRAAMYANTPAGNPANPLSATANAFMGTPMGRGFSLFGDLLGGGGGQQAAQRQESAANAQYDAASALRDAARMLRDVLGQAQTGPTVTQSRFSDATTPHHSMTITGRGGVFRQVG